MASEGSGFEVGCPTSVGDKEVDVVSVVGLLWPGVVLVLGDFLALVDADVPSMSVSCWEEWRLADVAWVGWGVNNESCPAGAATRLD